MVKSVLVEENVQSYVNEFVKNQQSVVGLIVGNNSKAKDYVVKLVKCSSKLEDSVENELEIDENWIAGHAVELMHMLPGGLNITGVFMVYKQTDNTTYNRLGQALYTTYKCLKKENLVGSSTDQLLWTVVHFDLTSGKVIHCKQYDINDKTSSTKPADWRYSNVTTKWSLVKTRVQMNLKLNENNLSLLETKIKESISCYCNQLSDAIVEINNVIRPPTDVLDPEPVSTGKNRKSKPNISSKWGKEFLCNFYLNLCDKENTEHLSDKVALKSSSAMIEIKGSVFACAYLPSKSTVEEAVQELKRDLIKTIKRRYQLLSEDLADRKRSFIEVKQCSFPKRLSFKNDDCHFLSFDYTFQNEAIADSILRIEETLDISVEENEFDQDLESFSAFQLNEQEVVQNNQEIVADPEVVIQENDDNSRSIRIVVATGIAVLAAAFSYFTFD